MQSLHDAVQLILFPVLDVISGSNMYTCRPPTTTSALRKNGGSLSKQQKTVKFRYIGFVSMNLNQRNHTHLMNLYRDSMNAIVTFITDTIVPDICTIF